jgi:predicted metal-dependent hydrolase
MKIDQLIRSKRKTISFEIHPGGELIVRAPLHTSEKQILAILETRADWIKKAQNRLSAMQPYRARTYTDGELFWYLGRQFPLRLVEKSSPALKFQPGQGFVLSRAHIDKAQALFIEWYRKQTRLLVNEWITKYQKPYNFKVGTVTINSARTRWGSCTARNNLNFTYRLGMAQPSAIEYVVVHEMAHTRVKNHSTDFWHLVTDILPDWKRERAYLKKYGTTFLLD